MEKYIFGVEYNEVARGGRGNVILAIIDSETELFLSEKHLITRLAELQNNDFVINIKPFYALLNTHKYELQLK